MKTYKIITECEVEHLTVGRLVDLLDAIPDKNERGYDKQCYYDFAHLHVTDEVHSYRGYYEDLAIGFSTEKPAVTLARLKEVLKKAMVSTFIGWKGGEFDMSANTRIWAAVKGDSGSQAIVGVEDTGWSVKILTQTMDY